VTQDLEVVGVELVARADEGSDVGVDDRAVGPPDLHAPEVAAEHAAADDAIEPRARRRVAGEQRVGQLRLDDVEADAPRQSLRIPDRLLAPDARGGDDTDGAEDEQGENPARGELRDRQTDGGWGIHAVPATLDARWPEHVASR